MRIAVISDVHGNVSALDAVLEDAKEHGAETYWVLGDVVGYGHRATEVLDRLRKISPQVWLLGNHDAALLGLHNPEHKHALTMGSGWSTVARQTIRRNYYRIRALQPNHLDKLSELGYCEQHSEYPFIFLAHGAYYPGNVPKSILGRYVGPGPKGQRRIEEDYQENFNEWSTSCQEFGYTLVLYGHTHTAFLRRRVALQRDIPGAFDERWERLDNPNARTQEIPLEPGFVYNANPGSAGGWARPAGCPTYLTLDITTDKTGQFRITASFHQVSYDRESVREDMEEAYWPEEIWEGQQPRLAHCVDEAGR